MGFQILWNCKKRDASFDTPDAVAARLCNCPGEGLFFFHFAETLPVANMLGSMSRRCLFVVLSRSVACVAVGKNRESNRRLGVQFR